ncbi:BatD family protein [Rubritalea spongiae]|uniref:BatD family protein n=1 Tax=Rubritalea spongiae TaxID=430797 RepID=A0ABW5E2I7_9BACT
MNSWISLVLLIPVCLQAADPIVVRTSVNPTEAWQGQRVALTIEVLGKEGWAQIPNIPALKVQGAYVLPPQSQGVRMQEQIDGAAYTGQSYDLAVYPQTGGAIHIPETSVQVSLSAFGSGSASSTKEVKLPALEFSSKVPPGAEGVQWLVSTTEFEATQSWSSDVEQVKVGGALKRKITLSAADVSGMAFQPIDYPKIQGLGVYPAEPTVEDDFDRGVLSGKREEEVTYLFQGAGTAEIPAIELVWWDVKNETLEKVVLEGRKVTVTGGPSASYKELQEGGRNQRVLWWALAVLLGLGGTFFWKRQKLQTLFQNWKRQRAEHEKVYFDRFSQAAGSGDIRHTQAALMQWLDRINTSSTPAQLEPFLQRYTEGEHDLESLLHQPRELYQLMVQARKTWLKAEKKRVKVEALLPELNG